MKKARTTLIIDEHLKKQAQKVALETNVTFQKIINKALDTFLRTQTKKEAKKIVFLDKDMGVNLDNLTRDDLYGTPKV